MRLNTSCYYLSTNKATWEESKSNCSSMGAHLAVIEDAKDLMSLIRQSGISECFWIGPQDIRSRTDRLSSNPNLWPLDNKDKQNCGCVRREGIKSENCKSKQHWICERQTAH
ncbi:killer cell lectin-like receptor subfamily G member 1 [Polypterus senegalus]|uniref:killer cell lectin-like receptor subfamily G member 1 n=1 Tax=Polypterus senegalus TaxID=55291 RepID=UPI0019627DD4|nr:killer cell lectin-like receptor subfamily G member 1 [Polypterus senegalus]